MGGRSGNTKSKYKYAIAACLGCFLGSYVEGGYDAGKVLRKRGENRSVYDGGLAPEEKPQGHIRDILSFLV
jgi:hypothetical protein